MESFTIVLNLLNKTDMIKNGHTVEECLKQKTSKGFFFFKVKMRGSLLGNLYFICIYIAKTPLLSNFNSLIPSNINTPLLLYRTESNKQKTHSYATRIVFELEDRKKKKKRSFQGDQKGGEVGSPVETKEGCVG